MLCLHNPKWAGTPTAQSRRESGRLDRPHGGSCPRKPQIASHVTAAHSLPISPIKTQLSERNMPSRARLGSRGRMCVRHAAAREYGCTRVFLARGARRGSRCSPDPASAGMRIGLRARWFVILSNRLGQDLTPFYLFMTVGQSQYSSYSNEPSITEPFYESSEESTWCCSVSLWKHGKMASSGALQTNKRNQKTTHLLTCVHQENAHEKFKRCQFHDAVLTQNQPLDKRRILQHLRRRRVSGRAHDSCGGRRGLLRTFSVRCINTGLPEPHYFVNSPCQKFTNADIWCLGMAVLLANVALKSSFMQKRLHKHRSGVHRPRGRTGSVLSPLICAAGKRAYWECVCVPAALISSRLWTLLANALKLLLP